MSSLDAAIAALEDFYGRSEDAPSAPPSVFELFRAFVNGFRGAPHGAFERLAEADLADDLAELSAIDPQELADLLRDPQRLTQLPAGFVVGLQRLAGWVIELGGIERVAEIDTETLHEQLRSIRGIGARTADRLLLDGLHRPIVPVTALTYRIFFRHGWFDPHSDETELRESFNSMVSGDPTKARDLNQWLQNLGTYCRVQGPRCDQCPLKPLLPESGPHEMNDT